MDIERPHRTTSTPTTTSELFICFTSRLSHSSSMRLSSKSILSPGHHHRSAADKSAAPLSLSSSLSRRRLRHNGSLRGAQSPAMFPSSKKNTHNNKGSSGFDNNNNNNPVEPSSPKVTCIGQVRVKTKKQGKKMKMRACRSKRLSGGEASFRRIEHTHEGLVHQNSQNQQQPQDHRNQRWVHLPLTICEALRTFGAEFGCLLPCKSSCFSSSSSSNSCTSGKGGNGEERESSQSSSCGGAVFRWLVARDIELVVGEEERERGGGGRGERMVVIERECSRRRSIFDDMEFKDEDFNVKNDGNNKGEEEEEEGGRASICIPPKNALLLMRCRSDPMRMSALSHKLWEAAPVVKDDDSEEEEKEVEEEDEDEEEGVVKETEEQGEETDEMCEDLVVGETNVEGHEMGCEDLAIFAAEEEQKKEEEREEDTERKQSEEDSEQKESVDIEEEEEERLLVLDEENLENGCFVEAGLVEEKVEDDGNEQDLVKVVQKEVEEERERAESSELSSSSSSSSSLPQESTAESAKIEDPIEDQDQDQDLESMKSMEEDEPEPQFQEVQQKLKLTHERSEPISAQKPKPKEETEERENEKVLPDCLLLMMCEPKLSMEVSKETWVCSTDFIRWLPERHHNKKVNKSDGSDDSQSKKTKKPPQPPVHRPEAVHPAVQPGRSSISFPAGGGPVANLIEQKLVKAAGGKGYEPFVLTRCKSAPMRSTAKIEPHRPATFGVGAAGVGF